MVSTVPISPGSVVAEPLQGKEAASTAPSPAVQAELSFPIGQLVQVSAVLEKGSTFRSFASKLANRFGWTASMREKVGLPAKSRQ